MDDQKDYFEEHDNPDEKKQLSRRTRLIIGIGASVIILALGLAVPFIMSAGEPGTLTVTVFSNNWSEITLKPGVETVLNEYLASESSVPGFPLRINHSGADEIHLKVDAGALFTWGAPDYVADSKGSAYNAKPDDTIYWSPFDSDEVLVAQCTLTVTARKDGADISQLRLIIRQTSDNTYSITLLSNE